MNNYSDKKETNLVGPIVLIMAGIILLLNRMGYLGADIWLSLLQMWPVLLIAAGIELLLGQRSRWGSAVAALLIMFVIGGAVWIAATPTTQRMGGNGIEISEPRDDIESARILLAPDYGELVVKALRDSGNLVEGTLYGKDNANVPQDFSTSGESATFELDDASGFHANIGINTTNRVWDIKLHPDVELDLEADIGVGQIDLDLTGLEITKVDANAGVGQIVIRLPKKGDADIDIDCGIGDVVIEIPEGAAVKVMADTAIVGRSLPTNYEKDDQTFTSPDYDKADERMNITVNVAIGRLAVQEISGD